MDPLQQVASLSGMYLQSCTPHVEHWGFALTACQIGIPPLAALWATLNSQGVLRMLALAAAMLVLPGMAAIVMDLVP